MKIIVTHTSPDMDAITSVWLVKKFLPGWENAVVQFVPAGERMGRLPHVSDDALNDPIELIDDSEVIHVDTGMGLLDHHQTSDTNVCGASLTFDFVKRTINDKQLTINKDKLEALSRMVKVVVDIDHFKEVFRKDPLADYHEFDLAAILDGLKLQFPNKDDYYVDFVSQSLDAILHDFENRIWAEKEIKENGHEFKTRFGKGIGFETINDTVVKLSQKMGYVVVVRKDPRKGYLRIKVRPDAELDLTLAYEQLIKMDPDATWFLHVSKKMLLNGSVKNPKMRPTKLKLSDIIGVLEKV